MSTARLGTRTRRCVAASVVAALALVASGCAGTAEDATVPRAASVGVAGSGKPGAVSEEASHKSGGPAAEPSLPPGDPGVDAPSVPAPKPGKGEARDHGAARRTVPAEAMLTADTVRMALGGGWEARSGGGDECLRLQGALGVRSMSYGGTKAGIVVETVATYVDAAAADAGVKALAQAAPSCGWTGVGDPRLGSASVAASQRGRAMTAVSSEGVVVLLVGTGDVTRNAMRWGSLADLALGTSCPAAPDGCH